MKNPLNFISYFLFTLFYAGFFSLGMMCLLNLLAEAFGSALPNESAIDEFPKFILFYILVGLFSLVALVFLAILNIKFSDKLNYGKRTWIIQSICAFVLSIPLLKVWELLFDFLQKAL